MKVFSLVFIVVLWSQTAFGLRCTALLNAWEASSDPVNVAFYMDRNPREAFRALNLKSKNLKGVRLGEDLIRVSGLPHLLIESDVENNFTFLLPKGLRFTAVVKEKTLVFFKTGAITFQEFKFTPESLQSFDESTVKSSTMIGSEIVANQALKQLLGSSTYQRKKTAQGEQFFAEQKKSFEYLLSKIQQPLKIEDLRHINGLITKDRVLRRDNFLDGDVSLVRGDQLNVELHQENTGINYMLAQEVPRALEDLLIKINDLNNQSGLIDVAEIYQDFIFIHPFPDGNGRTSRALLDYLLIKGGFTPLDHSLATSHIMHYSPAKLAQVLFNHMGVNTSNQN